MADWWWPFVGRYILQRLLFMIPVAFLVAFITFSLLYLVPGDPAVLILGEEATAEMIASFRARFNLDKPYLERFGLWMMQVLRGDLGRSWRTNESIGQMIVARLPVTIQLTVTSLLVALVIGIVAGVLSAVKRYGFLDSAATLLALAGVATPNFWLGILLIYSFAYLLGWLPPAGYVPLNQGLRANLEHMILPAVALGSHLGAVIMRQMRSSLLDVVGQDYIRTARAKGLREGVILGRHALKNALIPVITIVGLQSGRLFGGAVITETLFALPGIGRLVVTSVNFRDLVVVQGVVLFMALAVMLSNLVVDILYGLVDPRIRYG